MSETLPLAVDLDGTLVNTDLFFESAVRYIKKNPLHLFQMFYWLFSKGRAELKIQIEKREKLFVPSLPFNSNVITWLKKEKSKNRELILVTGASQIYAEQVAEHLNLFSKVYGVCRERPRLTGKNKARFLEKLYGKHGFDYAANSIIDIPVWRLARKCIVANALPFITRKASQIFHNVEIISTANKKNKFLFFKKLLKPSLFFLFRSFIFLIPVFILFIAKDGFYKWILPSADYKDFIFPLFGIFLLHSALYLAKELYELDKNRKNNSPGMLSYIHPYWGLLSLPLFILSTLYSFIFLKYTFFIFTYCFLEIARFLFPKRRFFYEISIALVLWTWSLILIF